MYVSVHAVYSVPVIDVGNDTTIGPELAQGKIGNTFIVVKGSRVFINCDFVDGGGFPTQPEMNLPATILWFLNGEPVDPSLYSGDHTSQLCFDAVDLDSGGNITCTAVSRIREDGEFLKDSASSIVTVVCELNHEYRIAGDFCGTQFSWMTPKIRISG